MRYINVAMQLVHVNKEFKAFQIKPLLGTV